MKGFLKYLATVLALLLAVLILFWLLDSDFRAVLADLFSSHQPPVWQITVHQEEFTGPTLENAWIKDLAGKLLARTDQDGYASVTGYYDSLAIGGDGYENLVIELKWPSTKVYLQRIKGWLNLATADSISYRFEENGQPLFEGTLTAGQTLTRKLPFQVGLMGVIKSLSQGDRPDLGDEFRFTKNGQYGFCLSPTTNLVNITTTIGQDTLFSRQQLVTDVTWELASSQSP